MKSSIKEDTGLVVDQFDHELVNTIINVTKKLVGDYSIDKVLNKLADSNLSLDGQQLLFAFTDGIQKKYGVNGAFATMRQIGREVAKGLIADHSSSEWEHMLDLGLRKMGFNVLPFENDKEACVFDCVYLRILESVELKPVEHCICWMGWGFIEGFIRMFEDDLVSKQWVNRNLKEKKCCIRYRSFRNT